MKIDEPITLNALHRLTQLDRRTLDRRLEGVPVIRHRGRDAYALSAAVRQLLRAAEGDGAREGADGRVTVVEAARRERLARAALVEDQLARSRGELVEVQVAVAGYEALATLIRQRVLSIADRVAPLVYDAKNLRAAHRAIRAECEAILREAAEERPEWIDRLEAAAQGG